MSAITKANLRRRKFVILRHLAVQAMNTRDVRRQEMAINQSYDLIKYLPKRDIDEYLRAKLLKNIVRCISATTSLSVCDTASTIMAYVMTNSNKEQIMEILQIENFMVTVNNLLYANSERLLAKGLIIVEKIIDTDAIVRDYIIRTGTMRILTQLTNIIDLSKDMLKNILWIFFCILKTNDPQPNIDCLLDIADALRNVLMQEHDVNILCPTLKLVRMISEYDSITLETVIRSGLFKISISQLNSILEDMQLSALYVIGNVCFGRSIETQYALDLDILQQMHGLILGGTPNVRRLTLLVLSNIAASNSEQVECIVSAGLIPKIIKCCSHTADVGVQNEAAWALTNIAIHANHIQAVNLIKKDAIATLSQLMNGSETMLLQNILVAFACILRMLRRHSNKVINLMDRNGALKKIRNWENNDDQFIQLLSHHIINKYVHKLPFHGNADENEEVDDEERIILR